MDRRARDYETGLLLIVALVIVAAAAFTWSGIAADRDTTRHTSDQFAEALVEGVEAHFEATLRDAANAAVSAALLIEAAGGPGAFRGEIHLHKELKRELWDERSTARLVLADVRGKVLASSAEYPVAPVVLNSQATIPSPPRPRGRVFRIGLTQRSPMGGELVLPYECDVLTLPVR